MGMSFIGLQFRNEGFMQCQKKLFPYEQAFDIIIVTQIEIKEVGGL